MSKKDKHNQAPNDEPTPVEDALAETEPVEVDLETQRDDLMDRLQRVSADYMNYQKRSQREKTDQRARTQADLIKGLLPVLDDMERALEAARDNHGEDDPLFTGMQLVHDKALEVLGKSGLRVIEAVGKPFDPDRHAALMQQPSEEHPPQTVLQELQKGYVINDQTLRPSGVIVSVEPEAEDDQEDPAAEDAAENET